MLWYIFGFSLNFFVNIYDVKSEKEHQTWIYIVLLVCVKELAGSQS